MTGFVITQLSLCDFRGFSGEKSWTLGQLTKITGHNYQGKSSIADAIAFALTGAPYFGGRDLDRLHHSSAAMMWVEAVLRTDEGKTHTVHRIRQNGRTVLSVDGATTTQERFAERFGSKDLFLSLLNPLYFAEVLGGDGRKLIEQYLSPVSYETVLSKLSETMRELLKNEAISVPATYVKSRREELKELEKDRLVLNGQMEQTEMQRAKLQKDLAEKQALLAHIAAAFAPLEKKQNAQDFSAIDAELQKLSAQYDAVQDNSAEAARSELQNRLKAVHSRGYASENTAKLQKMQLDLQMLYGRYNDENARLGYLQKQGACPTCLRRMDAQGLSEVQSAYRQRLQKIRTDGTALRQQSETLAAQEKAHQEQFTAWKASEIARLEQELQKISSASTADQQKALIKARIKELTAVRVLGGLTAEEQTQYSSLAAEKGRLESEIDAICKLLSGLPQGQKQALSDLEAKIAVLNDRLTAAKAYQAERAQLLFAPLQMHKAALKLIETSKSSGEVHDVFKLTYDGRDYVQLSLSERMRCGLEVVELLSRLSGRNDPLFVDNSESLCDLGAAQHTGQLILTRVVSGQTLQVQAAEPMQQKAG